MVRTTATSDVTVACELRDDVTNVVTYSTRLVGVALPVLFLLLGGCRGNDACETIDTRVQREQVLNKTKRMTSRHAT